MSLKDTIRGAREEAAASVNPFDRSDNASTGDSAADTSSNDQGFTRRSVSRAKPKRQAAAGVTVVNSTGKAKSTKNMSKEEQKAERKRQREKEDRRYAVSQMLLEDNPDYVRYHKIWWRILIVGFVFMIIALIMYMMIGQQGETAPLWMAGISMGSMVIAYAAIIIAFIYDWRNIRPIRKLQESRAASMTDKKINKTLREREKDKK